MFLTVSYHQLVIVACSVGFDVHGEDVEFHSRVRSLDKPRTVNPVTIAFGPAWGEEEGWHLSCPQEATTSTCRMKGNIFEIPLTEKKLVLSLKVADLSRNETID